MQRIERHQSLPSTLTGCSFADVRVTITDRETSDNTSGKENENQTHEGGTKKDLDESKKDKLSQSPCDQPESAQQTRQRDLNDMLPNSEGARRGGYKRVASLAPALESKPPSYMWLALLTIFFNFIIGLIALVIAMQSDHEYWKENITRARKLGRVVKILCLLAISTTCIALLVISIVFASPKE